MSNSCDDLLWPWVLYTVNTHNNETVTIITPIYQHNNRGLEIAHTGHRPIKGLDLRYKSPGSLAAEQHSEKHSVVHRKGRAGSGHLNESVFCTSLMVQVSSHDTVLS